MSRFDSRSLPVLYVWNRVRKVFVWADFGVVENALYYCHRLVFSNVTRAFSWEARFLCLLSINLQRRFCAKYLKWILTTVSIVIATRVLTVCFLGNKLSQWHFFLFWIHDLGLCSGRHRWRPLRFCIRHDIIPTLLTLVGKEIPRFSVY